MGYDWGNLSWGLPYRLGQVLPLNAGRRPMFADRCTFEVLPIGRRVG